DSKSKVIVAPCLLPESGFIQTIEIDNPRYWPMRLEFGKNLEFNHGKTLVAFTRYLCEDFNDNDDEQALSAFYMEGINEIELWNVMFIMERYFEIPFDVFASLRFIMERYFEIPFDVFASFLAENSSLS
ncbi:16219_t:CDS:2, partial [Cetraspora pellucida]